MGKRGQVSVNGQRTFGRGTASGEYLQPSRDVKGEARKIWKQVVAAFPVDHFTEGDRVLLEQYCEAAGLHRSATALIEREGRYIESRNGFQMRHPAAEDQRQARKDCAMLATKLRITKQARISPWAAGRAAYDAEKASRAGNSFADLLCFDAMLKEVCDDEQ